MSEMNFETREKLTDEFFEKCQDILSCKGKDYTVNDRAFGELKETAEELGIRPEQALWLYAKKHYSAIKNYIKNGKVESEPIELRLVDFSNYMALIYALIKEREGTSK